MSSDGTILNNRRNSPRFTRQLAPYVFLGTLLVIALWPKGSKKPDAGPLKSNRDFWREHQDFETKWKYPEKTLDISILKNTTKSNHGTTIATNKINKIQPWDDYSDEQNDTDSSEVPAHAVSTKEPKNLMKTLTVENTTKRISHVFDKIYQTTLEEMAAKIQKMTGAENLTEKVDFILSQSLRKYFQYIPSVATYTFNGKQVLWTFVPEETVSPLLQAGLATIQCHFGSSLHLQIITLTNLDEWISDLHPAFEYLCPRHKIHYVRARILDEYGGWFIDPSTIAFPLGFDPFSKMYSKLKEADFYYHKPSTPEGAQLASATAGPMRANTAFTAQEINEIEGTLDDNFEALEDHAEWPRSYDYPLQNITTLGLNPNSMTSKEFAAIPFYAERTWGQIFRYTPRLFIDDELHVFYTPLLFYNYSLIPNNVSSMPLEQILNHTMLISKILRFSYGKCRKTDIGAEVKDSSLQKPKPTPPKLEYALRPMPIGIWGFPDPQYTGLSKEEIRMKEKRIVEGTKRFLVRNSYMMALTLLKARPT